MSTSTIEKKSKKNEQPVRAIEKQFEDAKQLIDGWPDWKKQFFLELLNRSK